LVAQNDPVIQKDDTTKELVIQVLQKFQSAIGTVEYVKIYSKVEEQLKHKRLERTEQKKVQAVVNPAQVAQMKQRRNKNKMEQRKRKAMEHDHRRIKRIAKTLHIKAPDVLD
jgi:hypothetical protein